MKPKKLKNVNFGRLIEENRKSNNGTAKAYVTNEIYEWFIKKWGKGTKTSWSGEVNALNNQKIEAWKTLNRGWDVHTITLTTVGDIYKVHNNKGGAIGEKGTTEYFEHRDDKK